MSTSNDPYTVKDSGVKKVHSDGMQRDTQEGKPKFRLLWPEGVPYEEQLMYRVARHYALGGEKYGDRNWERSCTPESLAHHAEATERHLHKFLLGVEDGEDHAAAVVWGINAVLVTRRNIAKQEKPEVPGEAIEQDIEAWCSHECYPNAERHQHGSADACKACESMKGAFPKMICGHHEGVHSESYAAGCKQFRDLTGYEKRAQGYDG